MDQASDSRLKLLAAGLHAAGIVTVLAALVGGYFLLLRPLSARGEEAHREARELTKLIDRAVGIRSDYDALRDELDKLEQQTKEVRNRIPDRPDGEKFWEDLTALAAAHQIAIRDYRQGGIEQAANHSKLTLEVSADGQFAGLCRFLDGVAQMQRVTTVRRMEITSDSTGKSYPIKLTLVLYFGLRTAGGPAGDGGQHGG